MTKRDKHIIELACLWLACIITKVFLFKIIVYDVGVGADKLPSLSR